MSLRNLAFQRAFAKLFVYNILFEDSEQDERFLELDETSSILSISGAGCGVASMISKRPRSLDAVDINRHHLALAGLKVLSAQRLSDYETFYQLLGRGWLSDPRQAMAEVSDHMPKWMNSYWKRHWKRFSKPSIYLQGLTSRMLWVLRRMSGINASWLMSIADAPIEERQKAIEETIAPVLRRRDVSLLLQSPLQLLALGINYNQRDRILESEQEETIVDFFESHLKRLAETDILTNWFIWYAVAGHFNHDHPDAVPPYLRKDRHEKSTNAPTTVRFHHGNIFDQLEAGTPGTWSHYTLCDAPDWMPPKVQEHLLDEILRTSRDGAIVLTRSVEQESFVERIDEGKHFQLIEEASREATEKDKSRQYRRVDFFRVVH